ncbi:GIY-YIG nuclease family protein [Terricaulis silvestris]|uniref:GIY-YIG domain-containing protein n=1 Tax=Terricaulis silvestris TaxID=2686094 RepID=A0A6I6MGF4_9CAUL|nr:GIY-YIG nuclease family protein [Terricaulis silvestris]QGZ93735.1 hypothetical protein DSM104635_00547 [Terricaulis silvestris]
MLTFNVLLRDAGVDPKQTLLLRHQDARTRPGRSIYDLWRTNLTAFEDYQSRQRRTGRVRFNRPLWASFVGTPAGDTLFVGLYRASAPVSGVTDWTSPLSGNVVAAGIDNVFPLERLEALKAFAGLLYIDWGDGLRQWVQQAKAQDKSVIELRRTGEEPVFPGLLEFMCSLSQVEALPPAWASKLASHCGVYLLSCSRTNEHYVGSAYGADGFLGRWLEYARSGHGGNVGLKNRDPSDYRISILETAGTAASLDDILSMESRWKIKLQSREMGLNRN